MPKINVYLPDDLADAVRDTGVPVSAVCQRALEQAVRRIAAIRDTALADLDADQLATRLPQVTARARNVLLRARAHAQAADATRVGTGHLLAALLDEDDNLALRVLQAVEVPPAQVAAALAAADPEPTGPADTTMRFSATGAGALELAVTESTAFGHNYVGCEHLLLGLVTEPDGAAGQVLRGLGVELKSTRRAVAAALAGYVHLRAQSPVQTGAALAGSGAGADPMAVVATLIRRELAPITQRIEQLEQRMADR